MSGPLLQKANVLGLVLAGVLLAGSFPGMAAAGLGGDGMSVEDPALSAERPRPEPLNRPTDAGLERAGPETPLRRALHVGTYPVSAPPELELPEDRARLDTAINVAPDGRPLSLVREVDGGGPGGDPLGPGGVPGPLATSTLEGVFQYEDRELNEGGFTGVTWMAPVRSADVEYFDLDTAEVLGAASTNETGYFWMQVTDSTTRNVSFRALTTSRYDPGLFNASVTQLPSRGGQPYALLSPVYPNHDPATNLDFTSQPVNATQADVGAPFHIFDLAESAERYVENLTSAYPSVNLTVYWSAGYNEGKYYDTYGHIYLPGGGGDDDAYDDNVALHEIGHYITMSYSTEAGYYGPHGLAGTVDIRLGYVEALGSYFMGAIRNFLNLTQPLIYIETDGTNLLWFGFSLSYDTDTPSSYSNGAFTDTTAANEVAVAHVLYDVVDGTASPDGTPGVDDDALDLGLLVGDQLVWDVLISIRENATLFTKEITTETFYDQWLLVNPGYAAEFTQILLDAGIEYAADAFEDDDTSLTAASLATDGSLGHHTFFPAGDDDWGVFTALGGDQYVIKTQDLLDGADTVLELYDSDGSTLLLANNDRDGTTRASRITVTPAATQLYFVRVFRFAEAPMPIGEYGKYNLTVYILPNPRVTAVAPSSGPVTGGTAVLLSGSNFSFGAAVRFGVYDATGVSVLDSFTITAMTPANIPGSSDVTVVNPPNADGLVPQGTLVGGFTYTGAPLPPIVRSITPDFGTSSVATAVTVTGDYFLPGATLELDATLAASYTWVDARTITATVQPLPVGVYDVVVRNPDGQWDALENAFESAAQAAESVPTPFDWGNPISRTLNVADDFEIMDLYVYANITHPPMDWGGVRIELTSPAGRTVRVFDRIEVADSTGAAWRTRINATFGYDEPPSEVLWQFRGERTLGTWTLNLSTVLDGGVPSTLHGWAIYFFRYRHQEVSRIVLAAALYRNYVTGFDVETGKQLYRVRLQAEDPIYFAPFPNAAVVTRDHRHACGAGFSDYNNTRLGWTDSTVTCWELLTGRVVRVFYLSGNLAVDGLEAAADADRMVAATNEFVYRIDTTTMQITGNVSTGFPAGVPIPHAGVTPDGRKVYLTREDASFVLVVDLDALAVIGQIDTPGYYPLDVDITADGLLGYISGSEAPSAFFRFDPATDTVIDTVPIGTLRPVQTVLTPDGSKAFYTHYQWYAGSSRKDLTTFAESGVMPHPESTTLALAMGRDGTLFLADWSLNRIWVYNASTEALLTEILVPDRPYLTGTDVGDVVGRVALTASGGDGYVQLGWSDAAANGTPVQNYTIYRGDASGEEVRYASVGAINAFTDLGVVNGQTYYYRVSATNAAGEGPWSNEAPATPDAYIPEILNVVASPDPQYVGGPVNITAIVTDVTLITGVWVNVTDPSAGTTNSSMARLGATDTYYFEAPYPLVGAHTIVVSAVNADGNWNASSSGFTMIADTTPPTITDVQANPDPQTVGGNVNLTARVSDNLAATAVWANVTLPVGGSMNASMTRVGATEYHFHDVPYTTPGIHAFTVWATDLAGNWNSSGGHTFSVIDVLAPQILSVVDSPDPQALGGTVNITATITDEVSVASTWVNITSPGGGSQNTTLVRNGATDTYSFEQAYLVPGTYPYAIGAIDSTGNANTSSGYSFVVEDVLAPLISSVLDAPDPQAIGGPVNLTAIVTDDDAVAEVRANVTLPGGGFLNLSLARIGLTDAYYLEQTYASLGTHLYTVLAVDPAGNWASAPVGAFDILDLTPPSITDVLDAPDPQALGGRVNITANVTDDIAVDSVFATIAFPGPSIVLFVNLTRLGSTDTFFVEQPFTVLGTYTYRIYALDTGGNLAVTSNYTFTLLDVSPPLVTNASAAPDPQDVGGSVNITATVADEVGVAEVWVSITLPGGGSSNVSMTRVGLTDVYYFEAAYPGLGTASYRIGAADASGNLGTATGAFLVVDRRGPELRNVQVTPPIQEVPGRVNVSVDVTDNYALFPTVWIQLADPLGAVINQTMIGAAGDAWFLEGLYALVGTYSFTIWARDGVGNWNSTSSSFEVRDTTPPAALAGEDRSVLTGDDVQLNGSASLDNSGTIANITWRISKDSTPVATLYGPIASFAFGSSGTYLVTVIVTDPSGNVGEDSLTVIVTDPVVPDGGEIPFIFWVLLLLAIVTAMVLLFYLRRRRKTSPTAPIEAESRPAETEEDSEKGEAAAGAGSEAPTEQVPDTDAAGPPESSGENPISRSNGATKDTLPPST